MRTITPVLPFVTAIAISFLLPLLLATTVYDMTDYEQEILDEFRDATKDLVTKDFMKSDAYLLRWLSAEDFDLHATLQRFHKFLAWRKEKNVDVALAENFTLIDTEIPLVILGKDNDGRPLVAAQVGGIDFRRLAISGNEPLYLRYSIRLFELFEEYMHYLRETTGHHNISQVTAVYDLSGFNFKQSACYQCVKMLPELLTNYDPNYPNVFYRVYLINTPAIFYNVIRIARNFVSERNQRAIQVFDFDKAKWIPELLKQIPTDQLPTQYGGTRILKLDKSSMLYNRELLKIIRDYQDRAPSMPRDQTEEVENDEEVQQPTTVNVLDPLEDDESNVIASRSETNATSTSAPETTHVGLRHDQHHHHHHHTQKHESDQNFEISHIKYSQKQN